MTRRDFWILILILSLGVAVTAHQKLREGIHPFQIQVDGLDFLKTPTHEFTETEEADWAPHGQLVLDATRGDVVIRTWDQPRIRATVNKRIRAAEEETALRLAENLNLDLAPSESGLIARIATPPEFPRPRGVQTDLRVTVPREANIVVKTSHGEVEVMDLAGDLRLETSHGSVRVSKVGGSCWIVNRYGPVEASEVDGALEITTQHEDVRVWEIGGPVTVTSANGEVTVEEVQGNVEVHARHGEVRVARVQGEVSVEAPHSQITIESVKGGVKAMGEVDPLELRDITGPAEVEAGWSSVLLEEITGRIRVDGRHTYVEVIRPGGNVEIRTTHQDVVLSPSTGVGFRLEATAERGEVASTHPDLQLPDEAPESVTGKVGDGRHLYVLATTHSTIQLNPPR